MNGYGNALWVVLILALIWLGVLIYAFLSIYKRNDLSFLGKLMWSFIIFIAPVVGLIVYLILGRQPVRKEIPG